MKKADVLITKDASTYNIKIDGRATFESSVPLKSFADNFKNEKITHLVIDMSKCVWMDSTFMGTLAILGLKAKDCSIKPVILNIDEKNCRLMSDLGITILFDFRKGEEIVSTDRSKANDGKSDYGQDVSDTILKAHETLIDIDSNNLRKFDKVVELLKKDTEQANN